MTKTKKTNNYLVNRIKINNFYLGNVKFEDGYNHQLGTNFKRRPVLILSKFFDYQKKKQLYIVLPVYSNQKPANFFKHYHYKIKNWTSLHDDSKTKNVKFKINQIQILSKKELAYKYQNNYPKFFFLKNNSPFLEIKKLQKQIIFAQKLKFPNLNFKFCLETYLKQEKDLYLQKEIRAKSKKNKDFEINFF